VAISGDEVLHDTTLDLTRWHCRSNTMMNMKMIVMTMDEMTMFLR